MSKHFTALAVAATMAFGASQAAAVTIDADPNGGIASIISTGSNPLTYSWVVANDGNTSAAPSVSVTNTSFSEGLNGLFSTSTISPSNVIFEYVISTTSGVIQTFTQGGQTSGNVSFTLAQGQTFTAMLMAGATGQATATGELQLTPIPLPAGALLLLTALGGLAVARRRKSVEA